MTVGHDSGRTIREAGVEVKQKARVFPAYEAAGPTSDFFIDKILVTAYIEADVVRDTSPAIL